METQEQHVHINVFWEENFPKQQTKIRLLLMWEGIWNAAFAAICLGLATHHVVFDRTAHEVWKKFEDLLGIKINNFKVFLK